MPGCRLSLQAPTGRTREITRALATLARRARHNSACVWSEAYASVDDPNRLVLQAEWTCDEDLARYVRSDDFSQVLTLVEMAAAPPTFEFQVAGKSRGLDYVAELRREANART